VAPTPTTVAVQAEVPSVEPEAPKAEEEPASDASITLSGYVEAYYARNFANPENGITNNRWLDEKTNSFTLQTVYFDVDAKKGPFMAKVGFMFGPTADRWYFEGAAIRATDADVLLPANNYSNETFKNLQVAYAGYTAPIGNGLTMQGGLLPTQVGYESAHGKDNMNFSRSNLFTWLPFFHMGARLMYPVNDQLTVTAAIYNGWNQMIDLNDKKSYSVQASYMSDKWLLNALYLGGIERPVGDGTQTPWRNMFDGVAQYTGIDGLVLAAEANAGWEKNDVYSGKWFGAGLWAQLKVTDWMYLAARGDGIKEMGDDTADIPLVFGKGHLMSATGTLEFRPFGNGFSFRVEYRHDDSSKDNDFLAFYRKGFTPDGLQRTMHTQDTLTLGLIGWF
jgi:hypothetical protein